MWAKPRDGRASWRVTIINRYEKAYWRGHEMVPKLALLEFSICFMLLAGELLIRYLIPAWPFEPALYVPDYLTARDMPL